MQGEKGILGKDRCWSKVECCRKCHVMEGWVMEYLSGSIQKVRKRNTIRKSSTS